MVFTFSQILATSNSMYKIYEQSIGKDPSDSSVSLGEYLRSSVEMGVTTKRWKIPIKILRFETSKQFIHLRIMLYLKHKF